MTPDTDPQERRFVVLKPRETLLIGNATTAATLDPEEIKSVGEFFQRHLGVNVFMFAGDITVDALAGQPAAEPAPPDTH